MGQLFSANCLNCREDFSIRIGGGFLFHLLRCDRCGRGKEVGFKELGEIHLRYLKGLPIPYCVATSEHDKFVRENVPVEPITGAEYTKQVEKFVGRCWRCLGLGKYKMKAPPRCPKCRSTSIETEPAGLCYD